MSDAKIGLSPFITRRIVWLGRAEARRSVSSKPKHGKKKNARHNQYWACAAKPEDKDERAETNNRKAQLQPAQQLIQARGAAHVLDKLVVVSVCVPARDRAAACATRSGWLIGLHALGTKTGKGKPTLRAFVSFAARRANAVRCADAIPMKDGRTSRAPGCVEV